MHRFAKLSPALPLLILSFGAGARAATSVFPPPPLTEHLEKGVLPLLEKFCFDCHDNDARKGDVSLEIVREATPSRLDIRLWDKVRDQLHEGSMPPKNKPQPAGPEKSVILQWIGENESALLQATPTDPGPRKIRRLTRHEYNNALRDLLGVTVRPGDDFPADGSGGEGFENNADTLILSPLLIEKYISGADAALHEVFTRPGLKERICKPAQGLAERNSHTAAVILNSLATRAYRRPVTNGELAELVSVFDAAEKRGGDFDSALRVAIKGILVSPRFLLLQEQPGAKGQAPHPVAGLDLASRLSFLLWASLPDEELCHLAATGRLNDDAVLAAQVKRMLADVKANAFTLNFGAEWFRFDDLFNVVEPDRRKFPQYTDTLRQAMYDEAIYFTDHIFRHNGRVLDFLDSDYSYLNEPLAKFYGIPNVQGALLRRVKFTDRRRGGLLGMAAVLTVTSYPQRTSPVLRGKWVLEQILGTPPPPPPANIPKLPEDDRKLVNQTVRQRFEQHRSQPVCASCHKRLDPPGFGLETFNAIGQWRDQENGKPVDASGEMSDGRKFNGPSEFRQVLLQDKDRFVRTLCTRLLGYALGRGLEVYDQPTLIKLEDVLRKNDYHFEPLLVALVQSYPFRWKRGVD